MKIEEIDIKRVEAVIFDLDGVITDTARYHYMAWKRLTEKLGIHFDEKINEQLKGVDRRNSLEIILSSSGRRYGLEEKQQLAERKNEYYKELVNAMTPEDILPGVLQVLKGLKEKEIKRGLASASKNAFAVVDKLEIRQYFDYIADAAKIKKGKPDPEIFLTVAENLGAAPQSCIGVEDAEAGIQAIKSAGMYAIGIGDGKVLREADKVIKGLEEFNI